MPAGTAKTRNTKTDDIPPVTDADAPADDDAPPAVVEGKVETPKTDTLGAFQATFAAMKTTVLAQVDDKIGSVQRSVDDLAALVAESVKEPSPGAVADEEDYFGDKLADFQTTLDTLIQNRVTPNDFGSLVETVEQLTDTVRTLATGQQVAPMEPKPGVPAVLGQVLALMKMVDQIGKDGKASYGKGEDAANYAFRGIDAAMNAVGSAMRAVGLVMRSEVLHQESSFYNVDKVNRDGKKWGETRWVTTKVIMRYIFVSPIDGTEHPVEGLGIGKDFGDKDGSKAASAAMKYALFQGLCIPVQGMNIDPESESADSGEAPTYAPTPEPYDDGPPADYDPEQTQAARQTARRPEPDQADPNREGKPPVERALAAALVASNRVELKRIYDKAVATGIINNEVRGRPLAAHIVSIKHSLPET